MRIKEKIQAVDGKTKRRILFWMILLLGIVLRCIRFGQVPAGVNQDEAMAAVDAEALLEYGTDRYGTFLPVHFTAWKVSQMSVLLSYCMVPFLKLSGFHIVAVRLPMLLASVGGIALVYLIGKKLFDEKFALAAMLLTVINPWQFMQSRWSLDCNLFPHVFLLAFYLLLLGLEKRRYLYLSMVFFGLTFYCYGIAAYSVTAFLFVFFLWCLWKKQLKFREGVLCAVIFIVTALPEVVVLIINSFHLSTIETPFFTMPFFPDSVRGDDILLLNFSFSQLGKNVKALVSQVFLQLPDIFFNSIPQFGPLYHISIPFILIGIVVFTVRLFRERDTGKQTRMLALWGFLLTGVWVGVVTREVNINRVNIIFYPLIFLCTYGIFLVAGRWRKVTPVIAGAYGICGVLFLGSYFTEYAEESKYYYNEDFLTAIAEADQMEEYDRLYITGNCGWQFNQAAAEILTQYVCRIDALYYQEKTNVTGGRELLSYSDRYHFIYPEQSGGKLAELADGSLMVVRREELQYLSFPYEVIDTVGDYLLLVP